MEQTTTLYGSRSLDDARQRRYVEGAALYAGDHTVPLFWLVAFAKADVVPIDGTLADERVRVFVATSTTTAVERLRKRRAALLAAIGERFGALYDQFVDYVGSRLQPVLVASLDDVIEFWPRAHDRILVFVDAVDARRIDPARLEQFVGLKRLSGDLGDPAVNVAALVVGSDLAAWPTGPVDPLARHPLVDRVPEQRLIAGVESWIHSLWASPSAVDHIDEWGSLAQGYAIAEHLEPVSLLWHSQLDPDRSRGTRDAMFALSKVSRPSELANVITLMRSEAPEVIDLATQLVKRCAPHDGPARTLAARSGALRDFDSAESANTLAIIACRAAAAGDAVRARATLDVFASQTNLEGIPDTGWGPDDSHLGMAWALEACVRLDTWPELPITRAVALRALVAVRSACGEAGIAALRAHYPAIRDAEQPLTYEGPTGTDTASNEARAAELRAGYEEGRLTEAEAEIAIGRLTMDEHAFLLHQLRQDFERGAAAARSFVDEVLAVCDPSKRVLDRRAIGEARASFTEMVERATIPGNLLQLANRASALRIDPDGARVVAAGLGRLEAKYGPASSWVPPLPVRGPNVRDHIRLLTLLACAEGRALEAAALEQAVRRASKAYLPRAAPYRVVEGLARDGHLGDLRERVMRCLDQPSTPDTGLIAAMLRLSPDLAPAIRDIATTTLARLPSTAGWIG